MDKIKQYILSHKILDKLFFYIDFVKNYFSTEDLNTTEKNIFIVGVPQYRNLGDHAIVEAITLMLNKLFSSYNIVEITLDNFPRQFNAMKKVCKVNDLIVLVGGGNFGLEYYIMELQRRKVIKQFKLNKIILFPQTIDFGKSNFGLRELNKSVNIYGKHNNLVLFAREKYSYEVMLNKFTNKVYLVPDIVLSIQTLNDSKFKRNDMILCCLRRDCEKAHDDSEIEKFLLNSNYKYTLYDTVIDHNVLIKDRLNELEKCLGMFKSHKLVITDRLHGMIFAYITRTPCVVLSNYNHKIKGVYETWLSNVNYIVFCDKIDNLEYCLNKINYEDYNDDISFDKEFSPLKNALIEFIGESI